MEMQGTEKPPSAQYGVEAGYSEDYGAPATQEYASQDFVAAPTEETNGGQPKNPFTQQQYDQTQKSSNPFK